MSEQQIRQLKEELKQVVAQEMEVGERSRSVNAHESSTQQVITLSAEII